MDRFCGRKAFAFAEGDSIMLKVQAKKNTEHSETGILEGLFEIMQKALNGLANEVKI